MAYTEHAVRPDDLSRDDAIWRLITRQWLIEGTSESTNHPVYTYFAQKDGEVIQAQGIRELAALLHVEKASITGLLEAERRRVGPYIVWRERLPKGGSHAQ